MERERSNEASNEASSDELRLASSERREHEKSGSVSAWVEVLVDVGGGWMLLL